MSLQVFTFLLAGLIVVTGSIGVVLSRNPVHAALFLIQTLFGVAVEFLVVEAHFLAAIQVIVYAGAIVILFLFVIMLLGVDRAEDVSVEPIIGQRPVAILTGGALLGLLLAVINSANGLTGTRGATASLDAVDQLGEPLPNVNQLAQSVFTDYVFAFEVTGLLLTVAVVGAVVMARRIPGRLMPLPPTALDALTADREAAGEEVEGTGDAEATSGESETVGEGRDG